jgi:hypothetical protein
MTTYTCTACNITYDGNAQCCVEMNLHKNVIPLNDDKIRFLKLIAQGIRVIMSVSWQADMIQTNPEDAIEEYIKDNLLIHHSSRYCLSILQYHKMIDTEDFDTLKKVFFYFEEFASLEEFVIESCLDCSDTNDRDKMYETRIVNEEIQTFQNFFDY